MKAILSRVLLVAAETALLLSLIEQPLIAQAPTGPQGGPPPPQQQQQNPPTAKPPGAQQEPPQAGVTIAVDVPIVTLDVLATTQHGDILTGLKKENFRILDDGVPQTITTFGPLDAPITMVVLMEFSNVANGWFAAYAKYWADALFPNLKPQDWVALVTFDMNHRLDVDFTQNKDEVRSAIDTFSKHTLDQTMKQLRQSDVTIFCVGVAKPLMNRIEARGGNGTSLTVLQAENQLKTFSQLTGGYAWFPQFDGEIPGVLHDATALLRNQYSLSYSPSSGAKDGKFHKVRVELVAPDGGPLTIVDQKGKKQKSLVYAREGYQAPKDGVGD